MSIPRISFALMFALALATLARAQDPVTIVYTGNVVGYVEPCG